MRGRGNILRKRSGEMNVIDWECGVLGCAFLVPESRSLSDSSQFAGWEGSWAFQVDLDRNDFVSLSNEGNDLVTSEIL